MSFEKAINDYQKQLYENKITKLKTVIKDAYIILSGNDLISSEFETEILEALYDYSKLKKNQDSIIKEILNKD